MTRPNHDLFLHELPQGLADGGQGLEVRDVGLREGVAVVRRRPDQLLPLPAQRHEREIVDLGTSTPHDLHLRNPNPLRSTAIPAPPPLIVSVPLKPRRSSADRPCIEREDERERSRSRSRQFE